MLVKAERTGKHEFTAWTEYGTEFIVITKNAYSLNEMFEQIRKFWKISPSAECTVIFNDYTDAEGNIKIPNEIKGKKMIPKGTKITYLISILNIYSLC